MGYLRQPRVKASIKTILNDNRITMRLLWDRWRRRRKRKSVGGGGGGGGEGEIDFVVVV